MRHFSGTSKERELVAITYRNDMIFQTKSASLKSGARAEVGRVADMINLFPDRAVHVEVRLDCNGFMTNDQLHQKRVQAIKDALLEEGVAPGCIRTIIRRSAWALGSEDTVTVKVMDHLMGPFRQAQVSCHNGGRYCHLAC